MSKHDETAFSFFKGCASSIFSLIVCMIATGVFLATVNSDATTAVIAGPIAFLSFFGIFR